MRSPLQFYVRRVCIALLLLLAVVASAGAQERVVAIGDIHGAYPQIMRLLQQTGLLDAEGRRWTGGAAVLVQTGDIVSRGAQSRQCLDLLMELERQAPTQNGRVVVLLGNHEGMVIMGDLRYTTPAEIRAFATDESEKVRAQAYQDYLSFLTARRQRLGGLVPELARDFEKWAAEHPLGSFELRDAYGPEGFYGRWLRQRDTIAQVDDAIFLHGGLSPGLRFRTLADLNQRIRAELARFDHLWRALAERRILWRYMRFEEALQEARAELARLNDSGEGADDFLRPQLQEFLSVTGWLSVSPNGPLWYRGYAMEPEEKLAKDVEKLMSRLKIRHIVAAHTITDSRRITPRLNNRLFLIDTGMMMEPLRQGYASALEIQSGSIVARYASGERHVFLGPSALEAPAPAVGSPPHR